MLPENSIALKEWAAVCQALVEGRQSLLLRKGGIAEGAGGFRFEHNEFWLFPTQFHQSAEQLAGDARDLLSRIADHSPPPGRVLIRSYAVVHSVGFIDDESRLNDLAGRHVLADDVVRQRFHYRRPGLFVAAIQVFVGATLADIEDHPGYAGCHSWVDLEEKLSTQGLSAVVPERDLESSKELVSSLGGRATLSQD